MPRLSSSGREALGRERAAVGFRISGNFIKLSPSFSICYIYGNLGGTLASCATFFNGEFPLKDFSLDELSSLVIYVNEVLALGKLSLSLVSGFNTFAPILYLFYLLIGLLYELGGLTQLICLSSCTFKG